MIREVCSFSGCRQVGGAPRNFQTTNIYEKMLENEIFDGQPSRSECFSRVL